MNSKQFAFLLSRIGTRTQRTEFSGRRQLGFTLSNQNEKKEVVELEQINAELTKGLKSCRKLLFDYRSKLEPNSDGSEPLEEDGKESHIE